MSNGFNVGGAPMQMVRDLGTAGAVQGFRTAEITQGPRLSSPLSTVFQLFGQDGSSQLAIVTGAALKVWLNVAGTWKECVVWLNVAGTWKTATTSLNVGGVWK